MPSKYNRNHRKPILTIVEGGERTYIHPYSYSEGADTHNNKIHFLDTPEFPPNQEKGSGPEDFVYRYDSSLLSKGWNIVRRFWRTVQKARRGGFYHWSIHWNTTVPVFCMDIYRGSTISVPGTLNPSYQGQKLTDTYYLTPSQEWIKRKLGDWLVEKPPKFDTDESETFFSEARNSYLTWAGSQIKMGRKIAFLTSLDT